MIKLTKTALLQLYIREQKSVKEIGLLGGKAPTTVSRYLKRFGIKTRAFSTKGLSVGLGRKHSEQTKQKIREKHIGKKLSPEHRAKVIKTLSSSKDQSRENNPAWKGGRTYHSEGYVWIKMREHPNANKAGYFQEHRLVVEQDLGRHLKKTEFVHHKNGIKDDNRLENLELLQTQHHFGRTECPFCHKEFLIRT